NAYGVQSADTSVNALYHRLTGKSDYNSQQYEIFLESAAEHYLRDHPGAYLAATARRSVMIIFPKNYWGPCADQCKPQFTESLLLLARSPGEFALRYPFTAIVGAAGRLMDWLILPAGAFWGVLGLWKRHQLPAALPLVYTVVTPGPLYVTPRNAANAWAAT